MPDPEELPYEDKPTERFPAGPEADRIRFLEVRAKILSFIELKRHSYDVLGQYAIVKPASIKWFINDLISRGIAIYSKKNDTTNLRKALEVRGRTITFYPGSLQDIIRMVKKGQIAAELQLQNMLAESGNAVIFTQDGNPVFAEVWPGTRTLKLFLSEKDYNETQDL